VYVVDARERRRCTGRSAGEDRGTKAGVVMHTTGADAGNIDKRSWAGLN